MTPFWLSALALAADASSAGHRRVRRRALQSRLGTVAPRPVDDAVCDFVLPAGTRLFHGTLEPFAARAVRPGGDGFFWVVETPDVAQTYIPSAELEVWTSAQGLVRPTQDRERQQIQAAIGLVWDLDRVTWDALGRASSWPRPRSGEWVEDEEIVRRLREKGWDVQDRWSNVVFRFHRGRLLGPRGEAEGRLLAFRTKTPLFLRDHAKDAGEGDLLDPAYNQISLLHRASHAGCDGVRIHDFCQTHTRGNVGHISFGLFEGSLGKLQLEATLPARHWEWVDREDFSRATTPEWEAWRADHGEGLPTGLTEIVECGVRFSTGLTVTFSTVRNPEKAPRYRKEVLDVGQDLEPAGRYLLHRATQDAVPPGWEEGALTLRRPLVMEHGTTSSRPEGWKARLSRAFGGRRGIWLSRALRRAGYDGIVTVDTPYACTSEIVDLTVIDAGPPRSTGTPG